MPAVQDDSKRDRRTAKRILAIGLPLVVIAGTGIGYAFWTSNGTGTGSASTAAGSTVTVAQLGTVSGLAPGVAAQSISARVTNPASATGTVHLTKVNVTIDTITGAGTGGCLPGDYTIASPDMTTTTPDVAPGGTADFTGATIVFANSTTANQDGCKGATVNLKFAAS